MAAALEKAGLRTTTLSADLKKPDGFSVALQDLNKHLRVVGPDGDRCGGGDEKAFGGGRMGATITLLDQNLGRLGTKYDQIGKSTKNFGADWKATTETAAFKWQAMISTVEADAIKLGNDILPTVLTIGGTVVKDVDAVARAFTSLPKGAQNAILTGGLVLAAIGPAMKLLACSPAASASSTRSPPSCRAGRRVVRCEPLPARGVGDVEVGGTMNVGTLIARSTVSRHARRRRRCRRG